MRRRAVLLLMAMTAALVLAGGTALAVAPAGDATTTQEKTMKQDATTPSGVQPYATIQQLAASWGNNTYGQLGNGNTGTNSNKPVRIIASR